MRPPGALEYPAPGPYPPERPRLRRGTREGFGRRVVLEGPSDAEGRARLAFRLERRPGADGRRGRPDPGFRDGQAARIASGELSAKKVNGDASDDPDRATWTAVARALLNLDETDHQGVTPMAADPSKPGGAGIALRIGLFLAFVVLSSRVVPGHGLCCRPGTVRQLFHFRCPILRRIRGGFDGFMVSNRHRLDYRCHPQAIIGWWLMGVIWAAFCLNLREHSGGYMDE